VAIGINNILDYKWSERRKQFPNYINIGIIALMVIWFLTKEWMPLGAQNNDASNLIFVGLLIGVILAFMLFVVKSYSRILNWALANKAIFLSIPILVVLFGIVTWQGIDKVASFMPDSVKQSDTWVSLNKTFPGLGTGPNSR